MTLGHWIIVRRLFIGAYCLHFKKYRFLAAPKFRGMKYFREVWRLSSKKKLYIAEEGRANIY